MKKNLKKLQLNTEIVRLLASSELMNAAGGQAKPAGKVVTSSGDVCTVFLSCFATCPSM